MENFSLRTTGIIAVCFALMVVGWSFGWQKVAEASYQPVHCDCHLGKMICTPVGKIG
jgi:hypothetical protein